MKFTLALLLAVVIWGCSGTQAVEVEPSCQVVAEEQISSMYCEAVP